MTTDFDVRVADALFDAAASTPPSDNALNEILRRAETKRNDGAGRRATLVAVSAGVAAVGVAGLVALQPGGAPPASNEVAGTVATAPTTLPTGGTVPGPLVYDDATLLSGLYMRFGVGQADDALRTFVGAENPGAMATCMHDLGFEFVLTPPAAETAATDPRNVLSPADFAAQYGFGVAAEMLGILTARTTPDPNSEIYAALSPSQQAAYDGANSDCIEAQIERGEIVVNDQSWINAADFVAEQFHTIVKSDDRVVDALAVWHECMAAAGFDYEDPEALRPSFEVRLGPDDAPFPLDPGTPEFAEVEQIMAEEIAAATANASCVEPYTAVVRDVILERFPEYKSMFEAALEAGIESDGVGFS